MSPAAEVPGLEDDGVNVLGDQDAENTEQSYQYPPGSDLPTAQNVRRYPELFDEAVIGSFNVPDLNESDEAEDELDETTVDEGDGTSTRVTY